MKTLKLTALAVITFLTQTACSPAETTEPATNTSAPTPTSTTTVEEMPEWTLVSEYYCRIEVSQQVGEVDPDIIQISTETYASSIWDDRDLYRTQGLVNAPDESGIMIPHSFQCIFIPLPDELKLWRFMFEPGEQHWSS